MKKYYFSHIFILGLFAFSLFICNILSSNHIAELSTELSSLDFKAASLTEENEALSQSIASASAYATVENKALSAGFINLDSKKVMTFSDAIFTVAFSTSD